jgi:hypothetical protein
MSARSLGYWDYVKAAFKRRARVPLLGYVPYNYIALFTVAVLGAASQNPGFWFMGGALEIAYLLRWPATLASRNWSRGRRS